MKRRERRIDWRSKPAKQTIKEDPTIAFRNRLMLATEVSWMLCGVPVSKEELDRIGEALTVSVSLSFSATVSGKALSAADNPRLPSDVLLARSKFLG